MSVPNRNTRAPSEPISNLYRATNVASNSESSDESTRNIRFLYARPKRERVINIAVSDARPMMTASARASGLLPTRRRYTPEENNGQN